SAARGGLAARSVASGGGLPLRNLRGLSPAAPAPMTDAPFFVTGGTLRQDAQSYVARAADAEVLEALRAGYFCYVLTSRQMGKSSLMVRAAAQLRAERLAVVVLDLTGIG